ncbi:putative transcription factor bHLH041 [Telopea speciosissima]|uniref:putative transcription factor bHLH041 n=1 Tax=Telopea speciosissima TaxID=54955 RepID=UPI001CC65AED|nr:putative transcription factor bHLH041 [Telopea speciosissima]
MASVFFLDEEARARFLRSLVQSIGCTYVCLWYNYPPSSNYLIFMDGFYNDQSSNQPSSSFGSFARRHFDDYRQYPYTIDNGYVPGLAFKEGLPYLELKELELLSRVSTETQRQFYQEARIKAAAFMGCRSGEIEIGYSNPTENNKEMEMRRWFPDDFYPQSQSQHGELPHAPEQNLPSSSSSSLRSLSMGSPSPEYSSLLFNIPSTSNLPLPLKESLPIEKPTKPISIGIQPHQQQQQTMQQPYHGLHCLPPFQNPEKDIDAAMTRAILAVISSSSTSSSSSFLTQQNPSLNYPVRNQATAFKSYNPSLAPKIQTKPTSIKRQNMLKRAISFLANMRLKMLQEQMQGTRPNSTSTQLTHMISERKRREKLNESFQALRSLLPPGFKKDKASVLSSTRDYLHSLKAEISELKKKNQLLESQWLSPSERKAGEEVSDSTCSSTERVNIQVIQTAESTSGGQGIELRVSVRGDCNMLDLVIRILEFLKKVDMGLVSVEADTQLQQTIQLNRFIIRFNTKGSEWDESAFQEAIARIVADVIR